MTKMCTDFHFSAILIALLLPLFSHQCQLEKKSRAVANYHPHTRFPRSTLSHSDSIENKIAYFDGSEHLLKLSDMTAGNAVPNGKKSTQTVFPREQFTIAVWAKPEGGQVERAVVVELSDVCSEEAGPKRVTMQIGISTKPGTNQERGAAFYATLKTEMVSQATTLQSLPYKANAWSHLVLTYDGEVLKFYENGARVALSRKQGGALFSNARSHCKHLFIGGSAFGAGLKDDISGRNHENAKTAFRGAIHQIVIWQKALSHEEIIRMTKSQISGNEANVVFVEQFDNVDQWELIGGSKPTLISADSPLSQFKHPRGIDISVPPCGQTICDDPSVITNYAANSELRNHKILKYRIVNIFDSDGTNPSVTPDQIRIQHDVLNRAFGPSNISWRLEVIELHSTPLRRKMIIFGCDSSKIGNKQCNLECRHPITGNDGGDCDQEASGGTAAKKCHVEKMKGNRKCDMACNRPEHEWDWGECCNGTAGTESLCIDPNSSLRAYIGIDEYKHILNFSNEHALIVTFADWSNNELIGLSTFPWEKEVFSIYGGVVLQPRRFGVAGHRENLVHEMGHALGLWHVHHGTSEMNCDDPCREVEPSLLTGDLCGDTRPTPKNMDCKDPNFFRGSDKRPTFAASDQLCDDDQKFVDTPFRNYMSYSDEECTDNFTPHQTARMHCYIDLQYRAWQQLPAKMEESRAGVIPLAPRTIAASVNSVTLGWIPPLGYRGCTLHGSRAGQASCTDDGRVIQYAYKAYSSKQQKETGYWAPHQAVGPPDSEPCEASTKSWLPDVTSCEEPTACRLRLEFELPMVAETLSLWSAWNAADGIRQLLLHFEDGSIESVQAPAIYCDMPYTTRIKSLKKMTKIDVYMSNPFISIDAVEIISAPSNDMCNHCAPLIYHVYRTPSYANSVAFMETKERIFMDQSVQQSEQYHYRIQAMNSSNVASDLSPSLLYYHSIPYCGNGQLDRNEECDDGNFFDGDGCSSDCKLEKGLACKGEPSLCYVYISDGLCEPFEVSESVDDCGYFTPNEFMDQWPVDAATNAPWEQEAYCNASVLIGPPKNHACGQSPNPNTTWRVCGNGYWRESTQPVRLKVIFETPVVATSILVHLASDGGMLDLSNTNIKYLRLELLAENNQTHHVRGSEATPVSCQKRNGIVEYPIWHDLSKPYFRTKIVTLYIDPPSQHGLVLAGIRLRSRRQMDPVSVEHCAETATLYSPSLNQCLDNRCVKPQCSELNVNKDVVRVRCTGKNDGDTCTVSCELGHYLVGVKKVVGGQESIGHSNDMAKVTCLNGQWNAKYVDCKPVDCGLPKVSHARVQCFNGTTYGKRCSFYCQPPATIKGTGNSMTCSKNGVWTIPEAYCQLSCPAPSGSDTHSKAINKMCRVHYKSQEAGSVSFPVGANCKFMCKAGYHVQGQGLNKRFFRRICAENGKWTGPACVRVQCPAPKVIYAGIYNCTRGFEVGSECSFYCPGIQEVRISTCTTDGMWTVTDPCALPKGACVPPASTTDIQFECADKPLIGSTCKVSCQAYGYEAVLEHIVVTESNFKMQVLQKVNHTTCSVQKSWEPNVRSLVCVKKCTQDFVGDGWCDFQNNRGYCGWDGGDCCASTAKEGRVKLMFPSLCTSHLCQCLDPYAIENRNDLERAKLLSTDLNLVPRTPRMMSILEKSLLEKANYRLNNNDWFLVVGNNSNFTDGKI